VLITDRYILEKLQRNEIRTNTYINEFFY